MSQIRDSDFLAQNPATGKSLFELAQQQGDGEEHAVEVLAAGAPAEGSAAGRDESVEDLATLLVRQVSAAARDAACTMALSSQKGSLQHD